MEEMPERHTWAGQIMVSLDILCVSIDLRVACYHAVPTITATMEEMPERHTWAGQIMVSLDILCV